MNQIKQMNQLKREILRREETGVRDILGRRSYNILHGGKKEKDNMLVFLLIGDSGSGKTTWIRKIFRPSKLNSGKHGVKMHYHESKNILIVGKFVGHEYDGADRLSYFSYKDLKKLLDHAKKRKKRLVILEGDRFTNSKCLDVISRYNHIIAHKTISKSRHDENLKKRASKGYVQNPKVLKARNTKIQNLLMKYKIVDLNDVKKKIEKLAKRLQ